jgi:hypothetical protein
MQAANALEHPLRDVGADGVIRYAAAQPASVPA